MADLTTLLATEQAVRTAARDTISDMPQLMVFRDGSSAFQSVGTSFTTVQINTVMLDNKAGWDAANYQWVVPETGTYQVLGKMRLVDGDLSGLGYSLGMDVGTNVSSAELFWGEGNKNRQSISNPRTMILTKGDRLRLHAFVDRSTPVGITAASLTAVRIA